MDVTQKDLLDLLDIFEKKSSEAGACEPGTLEFEVLKRCEWLFKLDYSIIELENLNGTLCSRYPGRIFIPEYEHGQMAATLTASNPNVFGTTKATATTTNNTTTLTADSNSSRNGDSPILNNFVTFANTEQQNNAEEMPSFKPLIQRGTHEHTICEDLYDTNKLRELITQAKYARCRQRFPVPVIIFRGKYICRSATISVMPETYGRKVVDYAYDCLSGTNYVEQQQQQSQRNDEDTTDESLMNQINDALPFSYDEVIKSDIQLLNTLNVTTIVDLMVEMRKIKYFMAVSSSEKADPENHYENFKILSLPYPGCEFFKKFRDNNYMAKNLYYNWKLSFNDAPLTIPTRGPAMDLDINWHEYKEWDLVQLTQNYLKVMLKYIQDDNCGLLVHCISGWDRTPLFISLLRLSLWADGLIHQSLNPLQMAYLTLAYDWYLFGHQLPDRLKRSEDIMFFCFHVLKFIADEDFNIVQKRKRTKTTSSNGSTSSVIILKSDCDDDQLQKEDYFDQGSNDSFSYVKHCDILATSSAMQALPANGGIYSLHSATDGSATLSGIIRQHSTTFNGYTNRSPNSKRTKTKPITVPGMSPARQRNESVSSNGSWQVVTDTGSIDSTMNGSYLMRFISESSDQSQWNDINPDIVMCTSSISNSSGSGSVSSGSCASLASNPATMQQNSQKNSPLTSANSTTRVNKAKQISEGQPSLINDTNTTTMAVALMRKKRLNAVRAIFIQAYGKTIGLKFKEGSTMNLPAFIGNLADQLF